MSMKEIVRQWGEKVLRQTTNVEKWLVTCHLQKGPGMFTYGTERSSKSCNGSFNSS